MSDNEHKYIRWICQNIIDNTEHLHSVDISTLYGDSWKLKVIRDNVLAIINTIDKIEEKDTTE